MNDHELTWDKRLGISTVGRDDSNADEYRYPYEPTPYAVLERLADSGLIRAEDTVLDYGCGKGRVDFFLACETGADTVGIEYDERIFQSATENRKTVLPEGQTEFILTRAESYEVPKNVNRCYFFNPFSVEILHKVLARVIESYYENPREMRLFFYFPSDEYLGELMTNDALMFVDEIDYSDLFENNKQRERVLVFEVDA